MEPSASITEVRESSRPRWKRILWGVAGAAAMPFLVTGLLRLWPLHFASVWILLSPFAVLAAVALRGLKYDDGRHDLAKGALIGLLLWAALMAIVIGMMASGPQID
jgi:hypothetical protein